MADWLAAVTATVEAADYAAHKPHAWAPSTTRVYVVRGERPALAIADASDLYTTVDLVAGLLGGRYPIVVDAVIVVSTATAHDLTTGDRLDRLRVAYGITGDKQTSVIRRASRPGEQTVTGPAAGAFPDALDAALDQYR